MSLDDPASEDSASDRATPCLLDAEAFAAAFEAWWTAVHDLVRGGIDRGESEDAPPPWAIVGIKRGGAILAQRLRRRLADGGLEVEYGEVDIALYRDDYHLKVGNPRVRGTDVPFTVEGARILLVDDVLFTGRTVRAAINLLLDFGRPRVVELAAFVDRGHRELPIAAGVVGRTIDTERSNRVNVELTELGGDDSVRLVPGGLAGSSSHGGEP